MIAILSNKDFNPKYIGLIEFIFERGLKQNNYSLLDSETFSNMVVHNLNLKQNPLFNIPFDQNCQFQKIVAFTKEHPLLMYVK